MGQEWVGARQHERIRGRQEATRGAPPATYHLPHTYHLPLTTGYLLLTD